MRSERELRSEIITKIVQREGGTREQARKRQTWVHPWINGTRSVAVGTYLSRKQGGGFSVDFEFTQYAG